MHQQTARANRPRPQPRVSRFAREQVWLLGQRCCWPSQRLEPFLYQVAVMVVVSPSTSSTSMLGAKSTSEVAS